eukprot:1059969-Rhodomonas_salina.1
MRRVRAEQHATEPGNMRIQPSTMRLEPSNTRLGDYQQKPPGLGPQRLQGHPHGCERAAECNNAKRTRTDTPCSGPERAQHAMQSDGQDTTHANHANHATKTEGEQTSMAATMMTIAPAA